VGGCHVQTELLDQAGKSWRLTLRKIEHQTGQRRGVDDRMLERTLQPAPDQPCVECVVAVFDQDGALREAKKRAPRILELRSADQHRSVDVVAPARVGVDGRSAVDQSVEKGKRAVQGEPFGADLEDEERGVARRLHVERDELGTFESRLTADLRGIDRDLLPRHELGRPARFEIDPLRTHRARARARRAHAISSPLTARSSSTATP
jgi:hypothetical protein